MSISVVIPVYNSAESLPLLVQRLHVVLAEAQVPYEVILVNDASRDGSWRIIEELSISRPWLVGINLMRNYGQHAALLCGVRAARYETTITLDDDLQNPPEEIPNLINRLDQGFDVCYGAPEVEQHGL